MPYHRNEYGIEVDERGYLRAAGGAWAKHGIYPPPPIGDPHNPKVVEHVKAIHERPAKLSPEERKDQHRRQREFAAEFMSVFAASGAYLVADQTNRQPGADTPPEEPPT